MADTGKKMVRVTQVRSAVKRTADQQGTLLGLGLKGMNKTRELQDSPEVQGMLRKVRHLIRVESVG